MEQFRLYKILLEPDAEGDLFTNPCVKHIDLSTAQDTFEKLFSPPVKVLPIGKNVDTGEDTLPNNILANRERVTLIQLKNPGNVPYWKPDGVKDGIPSFPYTYIVIDNRIGIGQLAIQMNTDAWHNPDTVKNLLEGNLNRMLRELRSGLHVELRHKWLPSEFFEYIKQQRKEGQIVNKLYFEITNPEFVTPLDTAVDVSGHLRTLLKMLSQLGGAKVKMSVDAPNNKELIRRARKNDDIRQMVSLVATNGCILKVDFKQGGSYVCNDHLFADMEMPETYISAFKDNLKSDQSMFDYDLVRWLDEKRKETIDYKDDVYQRAPRGKRTRTSRSKIS